MTGIELFQIAKYNTAADNARIFAKLPALTKWVSRFITGLNYWYMDNDSNFS